MASGQQFEEDAAESVNVAGRPDRAFITGHLLRGHVGWRSEYHSRSGRRVVRRIGKSRKSEIQNDRIARSSMMMFEGFKSR